MWSAKSKELKSRTLRCAVKLDLMTVYTAKEADADIAKLNGSTPTLDWLIENGYLTEAEADSVSKAREREFPDDHLYEATKTLRRAVVKSDRGLTRLESVLHAMNGNK